MAGVGTRHMVRMAEQVVSSDPDDVLVTLGLGSCIGLVVLDEASGVAGLSHIVLPESPQTPNGSPRSKFADTAVPALLEAVTRHGGKGARLRAVVCGGASMFGARAGTAAGLQIGERNAAGTLAALAARRVPVRAKDTGGSTGRSIEVHVRGGRVLVRGVGGPARAL